MVFTSFLPCVVLAYSVRFTFDRYAMAAAVTEQLTFPEAMWHKEKITKIAARNGADVRGDRIAVVYDHLCRYVLTFALYLNISVCAWYIFQA